MRIIVLTETWKCRLPNIGSLIKVFKLTSYILLTFWMWILRFGKRWTRITMSQNFPFTELLDFLPYFQHSILLFFFQIFFQQRHNETELIHWLFELHFCLFLFFEDYYNKRCTFSEINSYHFFLWVFFFINYRNLFSSLLSRVTLKKKRKISNFTFTRFSQR